MTNGKEMDKKVKFILANQSGIGRQATGMLTESEKMAVAQQNERIKTRLGDLKKMRSNY